MSRCIGTVSRGIRAPIIKAGDSISTIVVDSIMAAIEEDNIVLNDRDIVGITEAVVARSQGNYASVDQVAEDIRNKYGDNTVGVIFPILSRNRFSICLKGIARGANKIVLMLSYPSDEVGNHLVSLEQLDEAGVNPWSDVLSLEKYREMFGVNLHPFTQVDYVDYYMSLIKAEGTEVDVIFANDPCAILSYTKNVLTCDIHSRERSKKKLLAAGAELVYGMQDVLSKSVSGSGYNPDYGILGSNKSTEDSIKLFPTNGEEVINSVQKQLFELTGKKIEVLVYGDGAFKDPVGKIWELADPVVSPAFTDGLNGTPNELKLKYLADNQFANLSGDELRKAIENQISHKGDLMGSMESQGTTPRRLTDLIGSLCDLTSGSGDKGTPIILIQGYFDNYAD